MILLILLACLSTTTATNSTKDATSAVEPANNSTKEILKASETSDPSKVEIVKQIRRLNDDGSYTIGYEADDGTFKIESRDVLGNVKGTFGYIDQDGEIKRVTYSSSSDATPTPVQVTSTSTTPSPPTMVVRVNKTVSSTTRRPLATVVYPTRSSFTTRGPAVQSIPRRRTTVPPTTSTVETTTAQQKAEEQSSNILNLYKSKVDDNATKTRIQVLKAMSDAIKEDLVTKQTTTKTPHTIKPVYEQMIEKEPEVNPNKANTIRRELTGTSPNPHMLNLRQSAGDDSTDVYGSHLSLGTVRPLFTTTTPRPRLVPIHSLVAARQKIHQQYRDLSPQDQETTIEASTGRVFGDQENVVTSNPVPVIHIPQRDDRIYEQQLYRRPAPAIHFRTNEYLRDNPGAPVPIGNQRPFLHYELQNKILEPQYVKEPVSAQTKDAAPESATVPPYDVRPVTRIIPIPVDERGIPIQGYQARYVNPYRPTQPPQQQPPILFQPRHEPHYDEMNSISTPVSTRDLKRLLQILILRQNRLQALMDQIVSPGPYQHQAYRQEQPQPQYERYHARQYQDEDQYDFRYDQRYRQQELYSNQVSNYESPQYESQRYIPRRRLYSRAYDAAGSSSNRVEDTPEYLPPDVREALLLKMLMLAINPDYMPTAPAPPTELTTATPPRKQVRNVQILGEEGSMDMKRSMQRH